MTALRRLTLITAWIVVPPALAAFSAQAAWLIGGGQARCFAELDLDTPGLMCAAGLNLMFEVYFALGFQFLLALPLSWWAAKSSWVMKRFVVRLGFVLTLLGMPLVFHRMSTAGVGRTLWETYAELAGPLLLALSAATVLAKLVVPPDDGARGDVAPAA